MVFSFDLADDFIDGENIAQWSDLSGDNHFDNVSGDPTFS